MLSFKTLTSRNLSLKPLFGSHMELPQVCVNLRVSRLADNYRSKKKKKKKWPKIRSRNQKMTEQIYMALTRLGSIVIKMNKAITRTGRGGWKRAYPALKLKLQLNYMAIHGNT